jgi:hypothetical protein
LEHTERVQQIVRAVLSRQIGVLEGARALLPHLREQPDLASAEDFNLTRGIESETDDLPLGSVRELWDPDALTEKDKEIARCEELWGDQFRGACERILLRLQRTQ